MPEDFEWAPFAGSRWSAQNIGDELVGTITLVRVEKGQRGDVVVVTVEAKDGGEKEVWLTTDLQQKLADLEPQAGDLIAMKLTELKHTGQPQPMKIFAVKVKKSESLPAPAADYDEETEPF